MKYKNLSLIVSMLIIASCTNTNENGQQQTIAKDSTGKTLAASPMSKGQVIFEQKCMTCHGGDGTAGIANAANLHTSRLDENAIHKTIHNGRGGMPSFGNQLETNDMDSLVIYVQTLRK